MTTNTLPPDDRETLSALFDGTLQGDAARFALKRLGHDVQWRKACGRWQLYGDVLRGQATAVASGDFAERVAAAVAQERPTVTEVVTPIRTRAGARRGWIGGALAASVAVAALFVARPFSDEAADASAASTQVAGTSGASHPVAPAASTAVASNAASPAVPAAPQAPDHSIGLGAAAVAAAEVPRRAAERRASRGQSQRAALRGGRERLPVAIAATAVVPVVASADTAARATPTNPFQPQAHSVEPASRPWPRAVLPQYSGGGTLTASYGSSEASPSFYPFEPRLAQPADDAAAHAADETPGPRR